MKTRIVFTKIHEDDYFRSLNDREQCFFFFLLTNERVNLSGMYHCPDWYILGVKPHWTQKYLNEMKTKFMRDGKFAFIDGWVKIINYSKYNQYTGDSNLKALDKELLDIPEAVRVYTPDTLPTGGADCPDSLNNQKSVISNQKSVISNPVKKQKEDLTPEQIQALSDKLGISPEGIMNWYQRIKDHEASKGVKYKDYPATIRVWIARARERNSK